MQGFYNVIKPTGMSSAAVVGKIKKILKQKRVGHMGTLDPAASGVLTIGVGKVTRFFDYFLNKDKIYYAIAEFGVQTDTLDSEGNIIYNAPIKVKKEYIEKIIPKFTGEIWQAPPIYSAINIDGKRAYELARQGQTFEIPKRKVLVYDFKIVERIGDNKYSFRIHCSSGTYVRSLLSDLAKSLGVVANIPVIIREKSGDFKLENANTLEEIEDLFAENIIKVENVFSDLKKVYFRSDDVKKIVNGVRIKNIYTVCEKEDFLGYVEDELFGLFTCENNEIYCKINLYEGDGK